MATSENTASDPMQDLTAFQRDILAVAADLDEPYGLAIKEALQEGYRTEVNTGRLYPNLDTLAEKGLIEKSAFDRRTNFYEVTERGQRELQADLEWRSNQIAE